MNGVRLLGLLGLASLLATGCASSAAPLEAQLGRLQSEIATLRSANAALAERVGTLEAARTTAVAAPMTEGAPVAPATPSRPRLEVVRLTPAESETDAQPASAAAAPAEGPAQELPRTRFRSTPKGIVEEPIDDPRAKPTGRAPTGSPGVRATASHSDRAKP